MAERSGYNDIEPFVTKDGSIIRELMRSPVQSLAEAIVPPGQTTHFHKHIKSDEFYHITGGVGLMHLGGKEFSVKAGDTVRIPPGAPHKIKNTGANDLKILCCCSPPYEHDDTELIG